MANFNLIPFSQTNLNEIFKISSKYPDKIISRESSDLEFKESFGWLSLPRYLKTAAAFANAKGGYIVFGIGHKPHKLLGLSGSHLKQFEDIKPEELSDHFNTHFSPEIEWFINEYELNGKTYGLIYINECIDKPVVCKKDAESVLKEGEIYYRYRGRSEKIKYSELRSILDQIKDKEKKLWMQHLLKMAKIGIRDVGIFDLKSGKIMGTGGSLIVDESLLSQLKFIKEGKFSDVDGSVALKLIGNVNIISGLSSSNGGKRIIKTKGIRIADIVLSFLKLEKVMDPIEYIRQICFESTGFLPVYYYMKLAKLNDNKAIEEIKAVISRAPAKLKLIERLEKRIKQSLKIPVSDTTQAKKKILLIDQLKKRSVDIGSSVIDIEYCLQAIRMLKRDEVKSCSDFIRNLLRELFNKYYSSAISNFAGSIRRSICWVDEALYMEKNENYN